MNQSKRGTLSLLFSRCALLWFLSYVFVEQKYVQAQKEGEETLDSILLNDNLPPSSPKCRHMLREEVSHTHNFVSYDFSISPSSWNEKSASHEALLFNAEIRHIDPDPNRAWTLRVGQGGNIYSFRGAFGEAIPPQHHDVAPFIDEVWQMVAVNQKYNRDPELPAYYIHQAGVYMKDKEYTEIPFYSPNIARHCESNPVSGTLQCSFASWGQHAHVPSPYHSSVLYFNRYQDCGNGVIEVTSAIQNIADKLEAAGYPEVLGYLNVPWGAIRTSTLKYVLLSDPDGELRLQFPLQQFGKQGEYIPNLKSTGGFTVFAQNINPSEHGFDLDTYEMPEADKHGNALPKWQARKKRQQRIEKRKKWEQVSISLNQTSRELNQTCQDLTSKMKVMEIAVDGEGTEKRKKKHDDQLRIIIRSKNSCVQSPIHTRQFGRRILRLSLKDTVEIKSGERICQLYFKNTRTGKGIKVKQIIHWSWKRKFLFFSPTNEKITLKHINSIFQAGDEIKVSYYESGRNEKHSLALTFVHGIDKKGKNIGNKLPSRLRFGTTDWKRDFTVYVSFLFSFYSLIGMILK